jgi:predicted nuclease with TOPRIM domain
MVRLNEITNEVLEDNKGNFLRVKLHAPDVLRFRMLTKKYKERRWNMFSTMLDFFEKYYSVLESKYFRLEAFLEEKTRLEEDSKRLAEEVSALRKTLEILQRKE